MDIRSPCHVRRVHTAGNGIRIATVELPDGTLGEVPAAQTVCIHRPAEIVVHLREVSGRIYPCSTRVEMVGV